MIKKILIVIIIGVVTALSLFVYVINTAEKRFEPMTVQRPENVPENAVFRGGADGGYFIVLERKDFLLDNGKRLPAYWLEAYDSFSGVAEFKGMGIFVSDREMSVDGKVYYYDPPSESEILSTGYFNGSDLEFDIDGHHNVGRIIPINTDISH
ncbi:hypothetical protein LF95_10430 [Thalassospira sp. TSL5-1]|nr:hypothetical protein LF95_10430 [Thalassospira sp. TSL5-1]